MEDNINPTHYKFGNIESMDFVDAVLRDGNFKPTEAHYLHNIIKYVTRAPRKNGVEDLEKAEWYLARWIANSKAEVSQE